MKVEIEVKNCEECPFCCNDSMYFKCKDRDYSIIAEYDRDFSYTNQNISIPNECRFKK